MVMREKQHKFDKKFSRRNVAESLSVKDISAFSAAWPDL